MKNSILIIIIVLLSLGILVIHNQSKNEIESLKKEKKELKISLEKALSRLENIDIPEQYTNTETSYKNNELTPEDIKLFKSMDKGSQDSVEALRKLVTEFKKYKKTSDIKSLIEMEEEIPSYVGRYNSHDHNILKLSGAEEIGIYYNHFGENLSYTDNFILNEAHKLNPNSKFREATLLSEVHPPESYCTTINLKAAKGYLKEFPDGVQANRVHMSLFGFYITVYNAFREVEDMVGRISFPDHVKTLKEKHKYIMGYDLTYGSDETVRSAIDIDKDLNTQKKEVLKKALIHYEKLIKLSEEELKTVDERSSLKRFSSLDEKNAIENDEVSIPMTRFYGCAD